MNARSRRAYLAELAKVSASVVRGEIADYERGMGWGVGGRALSLRNADTPQFWEVIRKLTGEREYRDKFSADFVQQRLSSIILTPHREVPGSIESEFDTLIAEMDSYETERTVYIPVSGIRVEPEGLTVGPITFRSVDQSLINELGDHLASIDAQVTEGFNLERFVEDQREAFEKYLGGKVVSVFKAVAEPQRAKDRAEDATRQALAVITFAHAACFPLHPAANSVPTLDGIRSHLNPWVCVTAPGAFNEFLSVVPSSWPIEITPGLLRQMETTGFATLSDLFAMPPDGRRDLESALLRATHWFAESQLQLTDENRLLNLVMCLETLLGPSQKDRASITQTLAEQTALLAASDLGRRQLIKVIVMDSYAIRSNITHGQNVVVTKTQVSELRQIVLATIERLTERAREFRTKRELASWFERLRMSARLADSGIKLSIREHREARGWSQVGLAERLREEPRMIDWWESGNIELPALQRLAGIFEVGLLEIGIPSRFLLIKIDSSHFLLTSHRRSDGQWEARVNGYGGGELALPAEDVDIDDDQIVSPMDTFEWRVLGSSRSASLQQLARRITETMKRNATRRASRTSAAE